MTIDYQIVEQELAGITIIKNPTKIEKLSLDYYHFSPVLKSKLQAKRADLVVQPTTEEEVIKIAQVCVKYKIPLTIRGAGTGNYGQCIPLNGGLVLDKTIKRKCHELG